MSFETTRRRFLALLSSAAAAVKLERGGFAQSRPSTPPELKAESGDVLLWFDQPAPEWAAALPVGNGRLGGMVFGGAQQERIALNEDTLWSGAPQDWNNPDAKNHLPVVRKLLLQDKDYQGADVECRYRQGPYNQAYEPVGDLLIDFAQSPEVSGYRRELNLDTAVAKVSYEAEGAIYTREVFASVPAQVVVVRLSCDKPGKLDCKVRLASQLRSKVEAYGTNGIRLTGKAPNESAPNYLFAPGSRSDLFIPPSAAAPGAAPAPPRPRREPPQLTPEEAAGQVKSDALASNPIQYSEVAGEGMHFAAVLQAKCSGGKIMQGTDGSLSIQGASEAVLLVGMATGFRGGLAKPDLPLAHVLSAAAKPAEAARTIPYERLRAGSVLEHQRLFRRVRLDLGKEKNSPPLPTDKRVVGMAANPDPSLLALYFNLGRYLLISSSRPGTQPANLQGIWNAEVRPPWSSNWTSNINVQMNYWLAETTTSPNATSRSSIW